MKPFKLKKHKLFSMINRARSFLRKEHGSVSIIVALAMVALIGVSALAIDYGYMASEKRNFQNALDAAALAGVRELPDFSTARNVAIEYLEFNGIDDAYERVNSGKIVIYQSADNKELTVTGTKDVNYIFAGIFGNGTSTEVGALATARRPDDNFFADNDCVMLSLSETVPLSFSNTYIALDDPIHSNYQVRFKEMSGSFSKVTACCGIDKPSSAGSVTISVKEDYSPKREMPEVDDLIDIAVKPTDSELSALGIEKIGDTYYLRSYGWDGTHAYNKLVDKYGDSPIYFPGSVVLENGNFNITGTILAKNDVTIRNTYTNMNSSNSVCFVSSEGNINVTSCSASFHGVFFAPEGAVTFTEFNAQVTGSVIADQIKIASGSPTFDFDPEAGNHVPRGSGHSRLTQ